MATFFIDYEKLVLQTYERKQANNALPHGLRHLTPARLRDECIMRCTKDISRRDEKIVREFCGDPDESKTCLRVIQQCDTDRFKPLVNYLKRKSVSTDPKNIELLAWLIDFPHRPWEPGKKYPDETNESLPLTDAEPVAGELGTAVISGDAPRADECDIKGEIPKNPENPIIQTLLGANEKGNAITKTAGAVNQVIKEESTKRLATAVVLVLALATGGAWLWRIIEPPPDFSGGCMYWREDHYQSIACDQKIPNAMIIALDTVKLKTFRKITTPDTITYQAIGKVWYSKIDTKIEFYTAGGEHPVVYGRRLKPITMYIIDKYIRTRN